MLFVRPVVLPGAVERAISVELVTLPPPVAEIPADPVLTSAESDVADLNAVPPPAEEAEPEFIRPTKMLAAAALADPRNAAAVKSFGQIDPGLVMEQLCGIEAVEQIAAYYPGWRVEAVVASAFAEAVVEDGALIADEAAFMVGTDWYHMRFECTVAPDLLAVSDFAFGVGEPISPEEALSNDLAFWPVE